MGPADNRRVCGDLGRRLASGEPLRSDEAAFLADRLKRLAAGEDANEVFGLRFGRGQSAADVSGRKIVSFLLHLVATYVDEGLDVEPACIKASEWTCNGFAPVT